MPRAARAFVMAVMAAGAVLLTAAALDWQSQNAVRFVSYLALAVAAATFKIRVPHMGWTLTPTFVLVLAALAEVSWAETAVISLAIGVVQSRWRPARRPMLSQVLFGPASLTLSAALAYGMSRVVLAPWLGHSVVGVLVVSTLVLFGSNMLILGTVLALVNRKPLSGVWQLCYFWSLPYYFVGRQWRVLWWPPAGRRNGLSRCWLCR